MRVITSCTRDCPDTCSLIVETLSDGTIRIEGNPNHPITAGFICAKTRHFGRVLSSPSRITSPLLKQNDGWKQIDWETALNLCAEKIQACRDEPSSILHIYGFGDKGVLPFLTYRFFSELGTSRVGGSLCDTAGIAACIADFGALDHNDITDLANARRIANWGKDFSRSSLHAAAYLRQARRSGARVVTISPGGDGNASFSDLMIRIRPGMDRFLAAAVIHALIDCGRIRNEVIVHTSGWPAFREMILSHSVHDLSAMCDVSMEDIMTVADFYSSGEPVATVIGYGLQRYDWGGENVRFINALALLSGNIGQSGAGSYFNIPSGRNFNLAWAFAPAEATRRTFWLPTIGQDLLNAKDPPVQMIWVNGCNVVNQAPEAKTIAQAFAQVPFKVVVDAFMTDTAEQADLILPPALMLEREEIVGSFMHNYINYAAVAVAPPPNVRTDAWIVSELGRRLDPPIVLPEVETCLRTALDSPYFNVTLEELREKGFVRAKRPFVAFANLHFAHSDGLYRFPEALHEEPPAPEGYPLRLLTLVRREALHSQILPEDQTPPRVWVAPDSPAWQGLDLKRDVYLASPIGRMKVMVQTLSGLEPNTVIYRRGDWMKLGGGANQLISAALSDIGQGAPYYRQWVRLEN